MGYLLARCLLSTNPKPLYKMSIFSLLPDILPMILPSAVHVTKAEDLEAQRAAGSNSGMVRQGAIVGKSDKMCATGEWVCPYSPSCVIRAQSIYFHPSLLTCVS